MRLKASFACVFCTNYVTREAAAYKVTSNNPPILLNPDRRITITKSADIEMIVNLQGFVSAAQIGSNSRRS